MTHTSTGKACGADTEVTTNAATAKPEASCSTTTNTVTGKARSSDLELTANAAIGQAADT